MRRTTLANLLFLIALGTPWLATVPRAQACTGSVRGDIASRQVFPANGSIGVPTNVQIVVSYIGTAPAIADHLALTTAGGTPVPVNISQPLSESSGNPMHQTFVLTPAAALAPNTRYLVVSDFAQVPCIRNEYWQSGLSESPCTPIPDGGAGDGGALAARSAVSGFTTGTGPDNTPPTLSGDLTYAATPESCSSSPCCGPYDGYLVAMYWASATDGGGPVFYELSREGTVVLYPPQDTTGQMTPGRLQGAFLCSGTLSPVNMMTGYTQFLGQSGTYQVVAVDLAGNRSAPLTVSVTVDCSVYDAGVDVVDSGPDAAADQSSVEVGLAPGDGPYPREDAHEGDGGPGVDVVESSVEVGLSPGDGLDAFVDAREGDAQASTTDLATVIDTAKPVDAVVVSSIGDALGPSRDGLYADARAEDAKPAVPDAGPVGTDAAVTAHLNGDTGCSCRVAGSHNGLAGFAIVVLGLVFVLRTRRRR